MKKIFVFILSFVVMLGCFACVSKAVRLDGKEVTKITVFFGDSGRIAHIEEREDVQALTENIGGLTFQKRDRQSYDGFLYSMKWYGADGSPVYEFSILNEGDIRYDGAIYFAKGTIDLGLIEEILNPYYQKPVDSELLFWITQDVTGVDFSAYRNKAYLLGAVEYIPASYAEGSSEYVGYLVSAYPDYADGGKFVTRIFITDRNVRVLGGLTITATVAEWDTALTKLYFERQESSESLDKDTEYKELWISGDRKLHVALMKKAGAYCLSIEAPVSNREGLLFERN